MGLEVALDIFGAVLERFHYCIMSGFVVGANRQQSEPRSTEVFRPLSEVFEKLKAQAYWERVC